MLSSAADQIGEHFQKRLRNYGKAVGAFHTLIVTTAVLLMFYSATELTLGNRGSAVVKVLCYKFCSSAVVKVLCYKFCSSTVVKVLCYKSEGRCFNPSWCHWNFSLT